jgi:hypothetical protein
MLRSLLIVFTLTCLFCNAQSGWPPINKETRPWTRWWWHGSAVTREGITAELEAYAKAGLGGVEITPIYGVAGYENKFIPYLSDQWMELLVHTLKEADRLNMGVDMATGTGWPFGGPWVGDQFASRNIEPKMYHLSAGETLKETIQFIQQPLLRTVLPIKADIKDLQQPISSNNNLQQLAIDQVKFERKIPLITLMGYSERGDVVDLTRRVNANGHLAWTPPSGKWKLYALFLGWHGKMVERAAPGGEGLVIDHFSKDALDHYLSKFDVAISKHDIKSLRAFFNDSYEVDDARGASDWTPRLFEEFQKRRGYDLKQNLPSLFDSSGVDNAGVLYDYRLTIAELVTDNFTRRWNAWASGKNKITRNQAHGSPANVLDLYSIVGIPETEGTNPLRIKMATSAGNISGKRLISSESATWLDEHFMSDLGDVKNAVDLFLLNGVNHIFYHGTSYSPPEAPWPGWLFYAAVHLNPRNPQWNDFHALNEYVARCQSLLQNSTSDNDIFLYYPIADPMSRIGKKMIQHFDDPEDPAFNKTELSRDAWELYEADFSYDFISDKQLMQLKPNSGKTILIPACEYIPRETMEHLNKLADAGVDVAMLNNKTSRYAGFKNQGIPVTISGNIKPNMQNVLKEDLFINGLSFNRRKLNDGRVMYLIKAVEENNFDNWISLGKIKSTPLLYNPMTGAIGLAQFQDGKVRLQLQANETVFVVENGGTQTSAPYQYTDLTGESMPLDHNWTLTFESGGPKLPPPVLVDPLGSWTRFEGTDYDSFSGTAVYKTHFSLPGDTGKNGWVLDLGDVRESVRVVLNGKDVCTLIAPPFRVKIEPSMAQSDNQLELHVSNLAVNRIIWMDQGNVPWKKFYNINFPAHDKKNSRNNLFDASSWAVIDSGLLGPVQLLSIGNKAGR